jgi:hypothetical protein
VKRGVCGVVELTVGDSDKGRRRRSRGRCGWWISIGTEVRVGGLGGDSSTAVVEEGEGGGGDRRCQRERYSHQGSH